MDRFSFVERGQLRGESLRTQSTYGSITYHKVASVIKKTLRFPQPPTQKMMSMLKELA